MVILDKLPIWAVFLVTIAVVLLSAEIGFRIGAWMQKRNPATEKATITSTMVGGIFSLMAFLLAFSMGIVINQHDKRKAMVETEAYTIETAYLRSGFLNEPDRNASRDLLREYVEVRLAAASDLELLESAVIRSEEIHFQLWSIVEDNARQGQVSLTLMLVADSINEVIDVHLLRTAAGTRRLPRQLGIVLYATMMLSFLLVGILSGSDGKRDLLSILLFAVVFSAVLTLIVDLDRPQEGLLTVSQSAMSDLLHKLKTIAP